MTLPASKIEDKNTKEKFVPKRRAPYLLQNEVIEHNLCKKDHVTDALDGVQCDNQKQTDDKELIIRRSSCSKSVDPTNDTSPKIVDVPLDYHEEVSKIFGIQKKLAHYFVVSCMARNGVVTGPVTLDTLCSVACTTKKTLKKTIQRMIEKKWMVRIDGKSGRGGFSIFKLEKAFIDALRKQLDVENFHLLPFKTTKQHEEEKKTSENVNQISSRVLPKEWQSIDCSGVEEIGFGLPQLRQIYNKGSNTSDTVQASINHFVFEMQNKPEKLNKYKNKLATFMSVLLKGGAWVEHEYMSPQALALKKLAKQKKVQLEKLKQLEEECLSNAFESWNAALTEEEKKVMIPEFVQKYPFARGIQKELALKAFFKEHIWNDKIPDELKKIKEELV